MGEPREIGALSNFPAYRATLLLIRWAQVKTALTFPFQIDSGLTEPIPNFANFTDKNFGLRTRISDIHKLFIVVRDCLWQF